MPTPSRKPTAAPPVLDYPAPRTGDPPSAPPPPAAPPPAPSPRPAPGAPVLDYPPPGTPSAVPTGGRTAQLAARVVDLLLAQGLPLPGRLSRRLPTGPAPSGSLRLPGARRFWWAYLLAGLGGVAVLLRLVTVLAGALTDPLTTWQ